MLATPPPLPAAPPISTMAIDARWSDPPPVVSIVLRPTGRDIRMDGDAGFVAAVSVSSGQLKLDKFANNTRGFAFVVRDASGAPVRPKEPPPFSPPPPPPPVEPRPDDGHYLYIDPAHAAEVRFTERAKWIFPKAGHYKVGVVLIMNSYPGPARAPLADIRSPLIEVDVAD